MSDDDLVVRFQNVGLRYGPGPEVLRDITFDVAAGSFQFLTGPSGAGKSSLLRLMYLAMRPTRGLVTLFGRDIGTAPRRALPGLRRRIGLVFQDFRLLNHLSVIENVELPLHVAGIKDARLRRNVPELLDWVGLGNRLNARPPTLSGGEQQRVAIARAVITRPALLLADEPTGNLDADIAQRLVRLFEQLHLTGTAVIVATHNEALVRDTRHRRLDLRDGNLSLLRADRPAA
ncbi:MAG: cell division ATP-binding protein FtsE [Alphaproteobacteria bacterium]